MMIPLGDVLRIRDSADMLSEFGSDSHGGINTPIYRFVSKMLPLCGRTFTVESVNKCRAPYYSSVEGVEEERVSGYWYITAEMLEPIIDDSVDTEAFDEALFAFLGI